MNVNKLIDEYYSFYPDFHENNQNIRFGTSGHRGSSILSNFNEAHVLAISQAIVNVRQQQGIFGPCYLGKDTRILSELAFITILEVLTANSIDIIIHNRDSYAPTPSISHAILNYNRCIKRNSFKADGIIVTASHNPPEYGGIKYNLCNGGPANIYVTSIIEKYANLLLINKLRGIRRYTFNQAWSSGYIHFQDFLYEYVKGLSNIINIKVIESSGLKLCVDVMGGTGIEYWHLIVQLYKIDLIVLNDKIDKTFSFLNRTKNNSINMDCSSEPIISKLLMFDNKFDLIFINDLDCDRHTIITSTGVMCSHCYLSVAIDYLFRNRPLWKRKCNLKIGKTLVSSSIIDRVVHNINCQLIQFPVGFKWFAKYLFNSTLGFSCEESSGATFLKFDCSPWSTDKDGIIMCLLAAEICANTGKNITEYYRKLIRNFKEFNYNRIQYPVNYKQKQNILHNLNFLLHKFSSNNLFEIKNIILLNNKYNIFDCIKVIMNNGWFAIRLSGTEQAYKIYCESFLNLYHRKQIETELQTCIYNILN